MIRTLAYVIIILIGLCLSPYLIGHSGYVYIAAGDYQIETSLVFAVFGLILFFSLLQVAEWLIVFILNVFLSSRYLPEKWRKQAAKKHTLIGALALAEEDWAIAEKAMVKGAEKGEIPALNLFAAARAAHHQNKIELRDEYLERVTNEPKTETAALTTKTRYLMQQGDFETAKACLAKLNPTSRSKVPVLQLAKDLYLKQKDWQSLKLLLPILSKKKILDSNELETLTCETNQALIREATCVSEAELDKRWHWLSKAEKNHPRTFILYVMGLCRYQRKPDAIKLMSKHIKSGLTNELLMSLPNIINADDQGIRKQLEQFAMQHEQDAVYHECMAKLAQQTRDVKQAKLHWQSVCSIEPSTDAWLALAQIHEQLGDNPNAMHCYRKAAKSEK
ncbi:heme biosynthesis HemY N-terminal domain-containing protein [Shewanella maritima]|uniref:heme biosynthesis HemY N-terminal domain-containing protein n=1 Tax=Shewanella maritima TaxID=2520507 RepID=UPI0037370DCB